MGKLPEFTTVVGVDDEHLPELHHVMRTWARNSPQVVERMLFLVDEKLTNTGLLANIITAWGGECTYEVVREQYGVDQRTRMLNALTVIPPRVVQTPYFLKLDTDVVAFGNLEKDIGEDWFADYPVLVAPRWGYTKPWTMMRDLDEWSTKWEAFDGLPRPEWHRADEKAKHQRIISWCCFVNSGWALDLLRYLPEDMIPVPSQDTFLWYMAQLQGAKTLRIRPTWARHLTGLANIARIADEACK